MVVDIKLADGVKESFRARINRQVAFKLASKAKLIRSLHVSLGPLNETNQADVHSCEIQAKLADGTVKTVNTQGMPNMCVADAAAWMSRQIGRHVSNKAVRWRTPQQSR